MVVGAVGGLVGFGVSSAIGSINFGADKIVGNFARYAAKAGISAASGFTSGFSSGFAGEVAGQMFNIASGNRDEFDVKIAAKNGLSSGLFAGGLAAATSIGLSIYDYNTWDKYSNIEKVQILKKANNGKNYHYASEADYNTVKLDAQSKGVNVNTADWDYNQLAGVTIGDRTLIFDNGLRTRSMGDITYTHETSHRLDNKLNLPRNEPKAFKFESQKYNSLTRYRNIDARSGYNSISIFNKLFNTIR
jgi:hypothetical protein